ncbi:MAG: aldose 1-epimerase [Sphingomonas bacterium]|nr:aldose 1-epimerase [Sphingomonas bacterium]
MITIASDRLHATISPDGAELQTLRDQAGRDYLWDGDPHWWTGRAPLLFPIVGTLGGDSLRIDGRDYAMAKHGFARRSTFAVIDSTADRATFRLTPSEATRAAYPFDFRLDVEFALAGARLTMAATLANPGAVPLPASFGFHPAFRWPLPDAGAREDHQLRFAEPEPAPIRRIDAHGLVTPTQHPSPVVGRTLPLEDGLFADDAIIFDRLASHALEYGAPDQPGLHVSWEGLPQLGVWTRPGAPYLCIEPWQGHSDPQGFAGDFRAKPGVILVPPGEDRRFTMRVTVQAAG